MYYPAIDMASLIKKGKAYYYAVESALVKGESKKRSNRHQRRKADPERQNCEMRRNEEMKTSQLFLNGWSFQPCWYLKITPLE